MTRETTSFDPKTWLAEPSTKRETTSFDPKTWAGEAHEAPVEQAPGSGPAHSRRLTVSVIGGLAMAALLAGSVWLWLGGREEAAPTRTAAKPAAPATKSATADPTFIFPARNLKHLGISLNDLGVPLGDAMAVAGETIRALGVDDEEMRVEVVLRGAGKARTVQSLIAELDGGTGVEITRAADGSYSSEERLLNIVTKTDFAEGTIRHATFYASAIEAGIPDSLITPFAKAFSFDFDFGQDVKQGDRFLAVWEERVTPQGRRVAPPQLIYAEMATSAGERAYYAFTPPDELELRWFDAQGNGAARGLMRTPVDGARITSRFGMRFHPIRRTARPHNGTDFAAPTGTPIYASGNATVAAVAPFAGAAGNMVKLQHDDAMQTWYMHMVRFADGLAAGQQVSQGQIIGYVGTTGGSTGPHLHYEIRIDGEPRDPLTFETAKVEPLVGEAKTMFAARRAKIDAARK